jgi:glycosyltransferase involved in cell wall biosynthesis
MFSPSEVGPYSRLQSQFDVSLVVSAGKQLNTGLPVVPMRALGDRMGRIPKVRRAYAALLSRSLGSPDFLFGMARIARDAAVIDVPETHTGFTRQALAARQRFGCRVAISVWENTPYFSCLNPRARAISELAIHQADAFIARSAQIRERLLAEGAAADRVFLIYAGLETDQFAPRIRSRPATRNDPFHILYVGKLHWEKGVEDLLRSFAVAVRSCDRRLCLTIVGEGRLRRHLEALAAALGIYPNGVRFRPNIPYDEMPQLYADADVVVVPSKPYPGGQEQCARVIQEAMACGRPVVATDCGGNKELLNEAGWMVAPADHIQLVHALVALADDQATCERMGSLGRAEAEARFSVDMTAKQTADVYAQLLGDREARRNGGVSLREPGAQ